MIRHFQESADIYDLQIGLTESAVAVCSRHADVVIDPEGDIAAESASGEYAEEAGFEIGGWNVRRWRRPRRKQLVVLVAAAACVLEVVVVAQSDGWLAGNRAGPNRLRPQLRIGGSSQHDRRNLEHLLIVFRELE